MWTTGPITIAMIDVGDIVIYRRYDRTRKPDWSYHLVIKKGKKRVRLLRLHDYLQYWDYIATPADGTILKLE
jgi:hypothetical protein